MNNPDRPMSVMAEPIKFLRSIDITSNQPVRSGRLWMSAWSAAARSWPKLLQSAVSVDSALRFVLERKIREQLSPRVLEQTTFP